MTPAHAVREGSLARAPAWWGAIAGTWLRVHAKTAGLYQGKVGLQLEGDHWLIVDPAREIEIRSVPQEVDEDGAGRSH